MTILERLTKASDLIADGKNSEANIMLVGEEAKEHAKAADELLEEQSFLLACKEAVISLDRARNFMLEE